jgi:hypothetical protein
MAETPDAPLLVQLADYPLFILRLFFHPRSVVRGYDWEDSAALRRIALYTVLSLALLVLAFANNRQLAERDNVRLSTYKGIVMRAHDRSWDWLAPVYAPLNVSQGEAKRLWDSLLTTGFLSYAFLAALAGIAVVARLRMAWRGLSWNHALGTGLLGLIPCATCVALALVPLTELLICRHCYVRGTLFAVLNLAGWAYLGYYTLGDLGERPPGCAAHFGKCLGYGVVQYAAAYIVFFALICCIIPL